VKFPKKAIKLLVFFSAAKSSRKPVKLTFKKSCKNEKVYKIFQGKEKLKDSTVSLTFRTVEITGNK
jgi:hypothetical protein